MSRTLGRVLGQLSQRNGNLIYHPTFTCTAIGQGPNLIKNQAASYSSKRNGNGPPSDAGQPFKTVTRRTGLDGDDDELNSLEREPNWELTSLKHNRFYLPNATGPAWQGDTSTVSLLAPLSQLVNFLGEPNENKMRLEFSCCQCPMLIRETLIELFPVRAVAQKDSAITLLTLRYEGDIETGAAKFVLAGRDISDRLLSLGYWADFLNPFSGRPYFMPRDGSILYKQDSRFRGINMRLTKHNECMVIAAEDEDNDDDAVAGGSHFSGTIYCTAPNNYNTLLELLMIKTKSTKT
ncbi:uncharacterized protein [Drosophila tropicalis]|uniref:uncharacterized protein n=1 Tax=Drosophila tropicalis TaxID=46794 RepID=UPI0035ABF908